MTTEDIENLFPGSNRQFKSGSPIIYQGEAPRSGFYIKKGIIKSYTLQNNGEERITGFHGPGDIFPLPWLYSETSIAMYYYETIENSLLISVTRDDLENILTKNTEFVLSFNKKLVKDQAAQLMRVTALEQSRAVEKIAYTFYYLCYRFGNQLSEKPDWYEISIKLTHSLIASLIGLTRETTAVEVNKLKKKEVLTYKNKTYIVNKQKLESVMGEDSFSELLR